MVPSIKKQIILEKAAKLFRAKGYKGTSLKTIASEVGMEAPSLYNHIQSKGEILSELLLYVASYFVDELDKVGASDLTPIKQLEKAIALYVEVSYTHTDTMSLLVAEYVHLDRESYAKFMEYRTVYEMQFKRILRACIASGEVVDSNVDLILFNMLSTLRSLYAWVGRHPEYNKYELEARITEMLVGGIGLKSPSHS